MQQRQQPQQQQAPAAVVPSPSAADGAKADADRAWTEHTAPTGIKYYYNAITKVSTYTKPEVLRNSGKGSGSGGAAATASTPPRKEESKVASKSAASSSTPAAAASSSSSSTPSTVNKKKRKWTEYVDKSSGKKYYHDGVTTTWDRPADYEDPSNGSSATKKKKSSRSSSMLSSDAGDVDEGEEATTVKKKKKKKDKKAKETVPVYNNKAEAVAAFKGLLLAKDVTPTTKWNDVVKLCSSDSRWEACTTMGERKQALAEYQTKRANELRDVRRQEKVRAKDAFVKLLTDVLPTVRGFHAGMSRFGDIRDALARDDRFYAVEEEGTREELFYDFVEELRKREDRNRRSKKRDAKDGFVKFLKGREERGGLTFASTWASFLASLDDTEKSDSRFITSPAMSDSDRQLYFADYVIELQAAEDEKRRRIRDARRRAEKAQRDAFRTALRTMATEGTIMPNSRWRNVEDVLSSDPSFGPVQAQEREAPREIFEDFVDDWNDGYRRDRVFLGRLVGNKKGIDVTVDTKYEDFTKKLLEAAAYSPDVYSDARRVLNREEPVSSARLYYDELVSRAKEKAEAVAKSFARSKRGKYGGQAARRASAVAGGGQEESSEDEGEIVEDGEVQEEDTKGTSAVAAPTANTNGEEEGKDVKTESSNVKKE